MDKIKSLKVKQSNGTFSDAIPFGANAENIDMADGSTLEAKISSIVNDFANYYDKTSIDNMLGAISSLDIQIVDTLPTTNISTSTIYLKPSSNSESENIYDEFIYTNNNWEQIGSTAMDLSGYITEDEATIIIETEVLDYFTEHKDEFVGDSGVYVGSETPSNEDINVWINPDAAEALSIPTKTSELTNDSGFITNEDVVVPTKISELENDSNYATVDYVNTASSSDSEYVEWTPILYHMDDLSQVTAADCTYSSQIGTIVRTKLEADEELYKNEVSFRIQGNLITAITGKAAITTGPFIGGLPYVNYKSDIFFSGIMGGFNTFEGTFFGLYNNDDTIGFRYLSDSNQDTIYGVTCETEVTGDFTIIGSFSYFSK